VTELLIAPALQRALDERNYTDLTPVQSAVIAPQARGRDLLVSAQTGSGKTVAYGLGIAENLLGDAESLPKATAPLALVVAPTRELALQVQRELEWLYAKAGARIVPSVGGMDPQRERRLLAEGAHIVVGTPGRLRDHIERNRLDLSALKAVVLDEADEMLDLGFREDLEFILGSMPKERRTLLFSATLPRGIANLAKTFQNNAFRIEATSGDAGHADIDYRAIKIAPKETEHVIVNVLRLVDAPASIIFCNTRDAVRHLQSTLVERGFSAVYLSGELGQNERNQALQALRDGRARICVATDVAARGIDLPNLGLVIHADLPHDSEILQHRSGRTGRAGRKGVSVVIVPPARRRKAEGLLAAAGIEPRWTLPPTAEDIRALDRQRMIEDPALREEPSEEDLAWAALLIAERTPQEIAAMLARIYRSRLPEPEEVTDPSSWFDKQVRVRVGAERAERDGGARERPFSRERSPRDVEISGGDMALFRVDIGRKNKADPKWLLPMLCRRGKVTRDDIGSIRIFDTTTEVEIAATAAEHFAENVRRTDGDDIRINPIAAGEREAPSARPRFDRPKGHFNKPERPFAKPRSFQDRPPREDKPREDKPREARSVEDRPRKPFQKPFRDGPRPESRPLEGRPYEGKPSAVKPFAGKKRFENDRLARADGPARETRAPRPDDGAPKRSLKPFERKEPPRGDRGFKGAGKPGFKGRKRDG
jgi:ATP-dependent RNA helicase DeaD